jgi:hypothetical protein
MIGHFIVHIIALSIIFQQTFISIVTDTSCAVASDASYGVGRWHQNIKT